MKEAKRHLGGYACISGNVPGSLLITGTPGNVDEYVKQLITDVAGDGGFLLSPGIVLNEANPDCVQAMIDAGKKYGAAI
jgi:uroporphyrinogen-III decarboxylase